MTTRQQRCPAFADQTPGTSGLRRPRERFLQAHFIEKFVQTILDCMDLPTGSRIFMGHDPRAGNAEALQRAAAVLAGNGHTALLSPADGLVTTPAASLFIARHGCDAGLLFTASHNPPGDLGLKLVVAGGGQAGVALNQCISARAAQAGAYRIVASPPALRTVDPITAHLDCLAELFDFERIRAWVRAGPGLWFDGAHGAAGPAARLLLCDRLGLPPQRLLRCDPRSDLGGAAPDPHLGSTHALVARLARSGALAAACDGDGDRNFLHAPGQFISPGDSLAVLAANLHRFPGYPDGLRGVGRTLPTSRAADQVARALGVPCHETPSGWRHFVPLLSAGQINLCGEEAFGTGSDHIRDKDGLWAITAWLALMADSGLGAADLLRRHWAEYGRHYYLRHDFENLSEGQLEAVNARLHALAASGALPPLAGAAGQIRAFRYRDPESGIELRDLGWSIEFGERARAVIRQSGTATQGATLRLYLEQHEPPGGSHAAAPAAALEALRSRVWTLLQLGECLGRTQADLVT